MHNVEKIYADEIEIEKLWGATKQGEYIFFSVLPLTVVFVFLFWNEASHSLLLTWFVIINVINFFRWMSMQFYHTHKENLATDVGRFKWVMTMGSAAAGLWWAIGIFWFLQPANPFSLLIVSIYVFIVSMGAILSWFSFLPAILAILFPTAGTLSFLLFVQGDRISTAMGLIICLLVVIGIVGCKKLTRMLNQALLLSFENVELRRESEEKSLMLQTALENMGQGISMTNKDDQLRMWNRHFIDLLDKAADKVTLNGKLETILTSAAPPITMQDVSRTEHELPDGRVFEIRQTALKNGGRVLTYNDISDLIKRERALEAARKMAEQANAAKTRFLAAASHDLRQPIHALGLFFAELSERVHNADTAELISQINDSISAISSMLNALLDVSKLDAGVVKPNIESFSLSNILKKLESEFMPIALENDNELRIRATKVFVVSDSALLERMLRNLISNALKYTRNGRVLVGARVRGEKAEIQVIDNGPGIPKDQLDDVFLEFHQVNNPARDRRQGLGLGLAIVKRQATLLKHKLNLVSQLGRGTCFSITLPLARLKIQPISNLKTIDQLTTLSLDGYRILVLDDDCDVLKGMQGLLSRWGCQVLTANSPADAFDQIDSNPLKPRLLIVDYRLPNDVSGIEVAKRLQSHLTTLASVLIITGDTGPERLREAEASGFPLLHKPVQPAKLRSTLQYLYSKQKNNVV